MYAPAGTSLAIMVFTAIVSSSSYYRRGYVRLDVVGKMLPFVLMGTVVGSVLAYFLHGSWLSILFGVFLVINGVKLLLPKKNPEVVSVGEKISVSKMRLLGSLIGIPSGLLGVGGGIFSVPCCHHDLQAHCLQVLNGLL